MKIILPLLFVFIFFQSLQAQQSGDQHFFIDTSSYTTVETALRQKGVIQKVEFINNTNISGINLGMIVIRNTKTGELTKGAYFANVAPTDNYIFYSQRERRAFIDEAELDGLLEFFGNCDSVWKKERPAIATSYEFETKDKLRIRFSTSDNSQAWRFILQFRNYYFFNTDSFSKRKSSDLYELLKTFKRALATY